MRKVLRVLWVAGLGVALLAGCDNAGGNGDGSVPKEGGPGGPDLPPVPEGVVTLKNAGETAEADFAKAKQYLVVPYSVSETAATAIAFKVSVKSSAGSEIGSGEFMLRQRRPPQIIDAAAWARWQQRLRVERWLRGVAEQAAKSAHSLPPSLGMPIAGGACVKSADCTEATEVCHEKVCKATVPLKLSTEFSNTASINALVKKKGTRAAVLVDEADAAAVSQSAIDALHKRYEETVHPRGIALFGDPPLTGSTGTTASDRNADGLVWLVLTKKVSDKKPAVGFFYAKDFTDEATSNKADILYVDSTKVADALGILAHELQHLLSYGAKVYKPTVAGGTGALEALWLDEGESHFAEDGCGFGGENTTLLRQNVFVPEFSDTSLLSTADSLTTRGMAFLFVRYLFEQKGGVSYESGGAITDKGGAAFLKALHNSTKQGTAAINEALGGTFADFKAGFDNWMVAVSLDGRGVTQFPRYVYQPLVTDPVTNNQIGVKIRGPRKDNTGAEVKLEGPVEDEIKVAGDTDGTIANATGKFFLLTTLTGKVSVSVTSQDKDFRFAVIRLQ